ARCWLADLADAQGLQPALHEIVRAHGKLSNLVFLQRHRGTESDWQGEIEVSLTATRIIIEHLTDEFDRERGNSIVVVGSLASRLVATEQPLSYHVAKAGLVQMGRYYAVRPGPQGIPVNVGSPGTLLQEESRELYRRNHTLRPRLPTLDSR